MIFLLSILIQTEIVWGSFNLMKRPVHNGMANRSRATEHGTSKEPGNSIHGSRDDLTCQSMQLRTKLSL